DRHLRQPPDLRLLAEVLLIVDRRDAVHHGPCGEILRDTGARPRTEAVAQRDVIANPDLPAEHHQLPETRAARDPALCDDHAVRADLDIVGDLAEVINLRPLPDPRR